MLGELFVFRKCLFKKTKQKYDVSIQINCNAAPFVRKAYRVLDINWFAFCDCFQYRQLFYYFSC